MSSNKPTLQQYKQQLETLGEFDMGPVADITFRLSELLGPVYRKKLDAFLSSDEVYKPDATRNKLIAIISEHLASESN